jgi:hypothetical protein
MEAHSSAQHDIIVDFNIALHLTFIALDKAGHVTSPPCPPPRARDPRSTSGPRPSSASCRKRPSWQNQTRMTLSLRLSRCVDPSAI